MNAELANINAKQKALKNKQWANINSTIKYSNNAKNIKNRFYASKLNVPQAVAKLKEMRAKKNRKDLEKLIGPIGMNNQKYKNILKEYDTNLNFNKAKNEIMRVRNVSSTGTNPNNFVLRPNIENLKNGTENKNKKAVNSIIKKYTNGNLTQNQAKNEIKKLLTYTQISENVKKLKALGRNGNKNSLSVMAITNKYRSREIETYNEAKQKINNLPKNVVNTQYTFNNLFNNNPSSPTTNNNNMRNSLKKKMNTKNKNGQYIIPRSTNPFVGEAANLRKEINDPATTKERLEEINQNLNRRISNLFKNKPSSSTTNNSGKQTNGSAKQIELLNKIKY